MRYSESKTLGATPGLTGVTGAILAGGMGTRLRPVVSAQPKVLAEVRGKPFLAYLLDQLVASGLRYVVLCTGYLGEQIQTVFGEAYGPLRLGYSKESSPLGTAGALRLALPLLKSDTVLVMNGDSFCEVDLKAFWTWHRVRGAEATLLLTQVPDTKRFGRVRLDADGAIVSFYEKDEANSPGWVNAGIYLLSRALISTIPGHGSMSLERDMFPLWINRRLYGYRDKGRFLDIGTPEAYATAEQFFAIDTSRWRNYISEEKTL